MIKKNGDNKWQVDPKAIITLVAKGVAAVAIIIGSYYATIGKITTEQAIQEVHIEQLEMNLGDQCARFMMHEDIQRADFGRLSDKIDDLKDLIIERMP